MYFSFYISYNFINLKLHYVGCIVIFFPNFIYIIFLVFLLFNSYYLVLFTSLLCIQNAQSFFIFLNNFLVFLSKTIKIKLIEIRTTFFVKISLLSSVFLFSSTFVRQDNGLCSELNISKTHIHLQKRNVLFKENFSKILKKKKHKIMGKCNSFYNRGYIKIILWW